MITISNDILHVNLRKRGAAVHSLFLAGVSHSLVFGTLDHRKYDSDANYLGTITGPVVNRIKNARAVIDGITYEFDQNFGTHMIHSGRLGLSELEWQLAEQGADFAVFKIELVDGHMGFPGPAQFTVRYALDRNSLIIDIHAVSEKTTLMNIAPHIYFNLTGEKTINSHELCVNASKFLPVDQDAFAIGQILDVANSKFDFRISKQIADLAIDNCFPLDEVSLSASAMTLRADHLSLSLYTNQKAVQIYTSEHMVKTPMINFQGDHVAVRAALAIEPQNWPNAPEFPHFPSIELRRGEPYHNFSRFEFTNA